MTVGRGYGNQGFVPQTLPGASGSPPGNVRIPPRLSIIIPVYNEEANIPPLMAQVFDVVRGLGTSFELLAIDDGSRDGSFAALEREQRDRPELKLIRFRRNFGQTAAIMAGIDHAQGEVIVSLDADLQNDPTDIPRLLAKLDEGYDVVSGWRVDRQDSRLKRILTSRVASRMISRAYGVRLNDFGCTLKAYRTEVLRGFRLYGEMHRFIPVYASWMGARVTEIPVQHHPRTRGASKYGLERVAKVALDMIVLKFLERHFVKPIYVFGGIGLTSIVFSFITFGMAVWRWFAGGISGSEAWLPLFSALFFLGGTICILMGLLAEMLVRTYFESQQRPAYSVRESRGIET